MLKARLAAEVRSLLSVQTVDYDYQKIGPETFLLPLRSQVQMRDGHIASRNEIESGHVLLDPLDEELDGFGIPDRFMRCRLGQRQRLKHVALLAGEPQRFTTGSDDGHVFVLPQNHLREACAGVDQMLAVVENKQELP